MLRKWHDGCKNLDDVGVRSGGRCRCRFRERRHRRAAGLLRKERRVLARTAAREHGGARGADVRLRSFGVCVGPRGAQREERGGGVYARVELGHCGRC